MIKLMQKYGAIFAVLGIALQIWLFGGHLPWVSVESRTPPDQILLGRRTTTGTTIKTRIEKRNQMLRPDFQMGMIFPQWGKTAYSAGDTNWQTGLQEIQEQTAAQWLSLTINFVQLSPYTTQVLVAPNTPTPEAVAAGIYKARAMGYHVFIQPLITVYGLHNWAGYIQFSTVSQAQAWFDSYWQTYKPYIEASTQAGAEELALGTEYEILQQGWSSQWNQLIARAHTIFPGKLTYDLNWTSLNSSISSWMNNPLLDSIGVSVYTPLVNVPERLPSEVISNLWRDKIGKKLDELSLQAKKPVLISEIGYRDSPDALFNPWQNQTLAGTDPKEQAAAYDAAMKDVIVDIHIKGIFFWAWSLPPYQPNNKLASRVLYHWFTSPLA